MEKELLSFLQIVEKKFNDSTLIKIILSKRVSKNQEISKIDVRKIELKGENLLQFVFKYDRRDVTKNYNLEQSKEILEDYIGNSFLDITLLAKDEDVFLKYNNKHIAKLIVKKASNQVEQITEHDVKKNRFLDYKNSVYLHELGITDNSGNIVASMQAKFKQIEKFVEIIANLTSEFDKNSKIKLADQGCGKGYLTFAVYDYLKNILGLDVLVEGIEIQEKLVNFCNNVAKKAGFDSLKFIKTNIDDYNPEKLDILIALHACDIATDDALYRAIKSNAKVIVVAPCCHKQIRNQMNFLKQNPLNSILEYGLLKERFAELLTDGLRAEILRSLGYKVKVFEFVEYDNTAKNLIITAVKSDNCKVDREKFNQNIQAIKDMFGINYHYLEKLIENPTDRSFEIKNAVCITKE